MSEHSAGFSLIEVLMAMVLIAVCILAAAPMFVYASKGNATGADLGSAGAIAVERMELLRSLTFSSLDVGGSLTSNVPSYSELSNGEFEVRWQIATSAGLSGSKAIDVRVVALRQVVGQPKEVTLTTMRSR